jgi:hypothetical protein
MTLSEALVAVWRQSIVERATEVEVDHHRFTVGATRAKGLTCVSFSFGGHAIEGIEQNPETASRWAKLAREGKRIMQFSSRRRYFANVCEGAITRYPTWASLGLPE